MTAEPIYCTHCQDYIIPDDDGCCNNCESIIDLSKWQDSEEAFASDARQMEYDSRFEPSYFGFAQGSQSGVRY